jgi:hypothetical protein
MTSNHFGGCKSSLRNATKGISKMSDSGTKIVTVTADNQEELQQRRRRRYLHKAFLKARDRRKNFERGELAGFIYCTGLAAIVVSASGQLNHIELAIEPRVAMGVLGAILLLGKTIIKRQFWQQTEDAEYKEEDNGNRRSERASTEL